MTALLPDISAWTAWIIPGGFNPMYRQGPTVTFEGHRIRDQVNQTNVQIQPRAELGDEREGLLKEIHKMIKGEATGKIAEALPQYRLQP